MESSKLFWEELCGTYAFNRLGLKEINRENIILFDDYYWNYYPYLKKYLSIPEIEKKNVLEIGLGFGTVSQYLFENAKSYVGVDFSINPCNIVNQRIAWSNKINQTNTAINADAKFLPFSDKSFDFVVSIGCLHHTGDTQKSIDEVFRVLKPDGECLIMLYNKKSYRRKLSYLLFKKDLLLGLTQHKNFSNYVKSLYDSNSSGDAAPIIDFYSIAELKLMFSKFSSTNFHLENNNIRHIRKYLLNNFSKYFGLDTYISAKK
ncbi:MAG: class I SAM-dependent methyltransferase [Saprospiraceae bacterium]|nr:class I SAM-dependent methyltransferase [Saprospiraceae bacterium]